MRDYLWQPHRWLGQSWPRSIYHLSYALPASDAPVSELPGHRRDNVSLPDQVLGAALPQPPLVLDMYPSI